MTLDEARSLEREQLEAANANLRWSLGVACEEVRLLEDLVGRLTGRGDTVAEALAFAVADERARCLGIAEGWADTKAGRDIAANIRGGAT